MSLLEFRDACGYVFFDEAECRAAGSRLHQSYKAAQPFPHIVIDDFLPKDVLVAAAAAFPTNFRKQLFDRDQERFKAQLHPNETDSGLIRNIFAELNSHAFLSFLEELTGEVGLIPDPHFDGGGLHETKQGGHLSIHADFNLHMPMKVERRLNLIVYLNPGWLEEYGGDLELWDSDMTSCRVKVAPELGRAVVFTTSADSFHGHPEPLSCPAEITRKSLATYYYRSFNDFGEVRSTRFKRRPGSSDKQDVRTAFHHFIGDWVPPRLQNTVRRIFR